MSSSRPLQVPLALSAITSGLRLYPPEHPQIGRLLAGSLATLQGQLMGREKLTIGLIDGTLLINDIPCLEQPAGVQEFIRQLERQQLKAFDILPELDSRQLLLFCQHLPHPRPGDFLQQLQSLGVTAIRHAEIDEEEHGTEAIYRSAMETVEEVCKDVRLGRVPASHKATRTVKGMVKNILDEPYALLAMAMLKDYDNYTFCHSVNVSVLSMSVGKACGVSHQELYDLGLGGLLHDLGKMTIDHQIVAKPGKLSASEQQQMQQHPANGAKIVAGMEQMPSRVVDIVNHHHLRYDRTGYPADSRGRQVTPLADMTSIADTYDAMTTLRCYQRQLTPRQALERLQSLSGTSLHPEYVDQFLSYLGPYPVGTLVRLKNGTIGLVCDQNRQQLGSLTLKIIFDYEGNLLCEPDLLQLPDERKIVAEVDPGLKGVRLENYLP